MKLSKNMNRYRNAALALLVPLAMSGCGKTNNYNLLSPAADTTPNYNLSDDGLAFTSSGQSISASSVRSFWNVANGTSIHLFTSQTASNNNRILYASFFDGEAFTPPVQIQGVNEDPMANVNGVKVLFLNTAGFSGATAADTANAQARDGDAIILFVRQDHGAPTGEEDANDRLYGTYFQRSGSATAVSGTVEYGFETVATAIDFNHVRTGGSDPDVTTFGFVSDSLHGSHAFTSGTDGVDSGDPTTLAEIVWRKRPRDGGASTGERYYHATFSLTQDGNAMPAQASANSDLLSPPAAAGSYDNADAVDAGVVVHNNHLFWRVTDLGVTSDDIVTDSIFTAPGVWTDTLLGSDVTAQTDTTDLPSAGNVYGGDQGLTAVYALFTENGFSSNGTTGDRANDRDLMLAKIDDGQQARELLEIDAFTGLVDRTDVDTDGARVRRGDDGAVSSGSVHSRINRTGSYLTVLWLQKTSDLTDLNDNNATIRAPEKNNALYAQVVQTRRDATTRTIANSVLASVLKSPELDSTGDTNSSGQQQDDVDHVSFQAELPSGQSHWNGLGSGHPDLGSAIQSNNLRMNWTYQQLVDQSLADNNDERLLVNGLTVTLDTTGSAQPAAVLASATQAVVSPGFDQNYSGSYSAVAVDRGNAAGDVNVYFFQNGNNPTDANAGSAFDELRLYSYDGSVTQLLSTDGSTDLNQADGFLNVITVPARIDVAAAPDWSGTRTHVYWTEYSSTTSGALRLATRSFEKAAAAPVFAPDAANGPFFLDSPVDGDVGTQTLTFLTGSFITGVYFDENGHLYYTETRGTAAEYPVADGVSASVQLDTDSKWAISGANIASKPGVHDLFGSIAFWSKVDPAGDQRVSLTVHLK